jgi:septal ring factor EnvC (AmiA/AmiB activator)
MGWKTWGIIAAVLVVAAAVGWIYAADALDLWVTHRLKEREAALSKIVEEKEKLAADAEARFLAAQGRASQAEVKAKTAEARAAEFKKQADQQAAERQQLVVRLRETEATLQQIREEALHVPTSELLARIRHALERLRAPIAVPVRCPGG